MNGALRNSSINWIFLARLPIQNQSKPSITKKRRNKNKYFIWNSIRLMFLKKTSMLNPVESCEYIKCCSSSSTRPMKEPSNSIIYSCQKIGSWSRRPETILEIRKKPTFIWVMNKLITCKFFKDFINHKKKTNRTVFFLWCFFNQVSARENQSFPRFF